MPSSTFLLILNGAILAGCAFFIDAERQLILTALMLFLPLADKNIFRINYKLKKYSFYLWALPLGLIVALLLFEPSKQATIIGIIFLTALPEEWFFRAYFQRRLHLLIANNNLNLRLSAGMSANIITSLFFTLLHIPIQGITALGIFIPSLILGWLYQLKQDIIVVILTHALFNLFFIIFIQEQLQSYWQ